MSQAPLSKEQLRHAWRVYEACGFSVSAAARELNVARSTLENRLTEARRRLKLKEDPAELARIRAAQKEIKRKAAAREKEQASGQRLRELQLEVSNITEELAKERKKIALLEGVSRDLAPPRWLIPPRTKGPERTVATAFLSDLHLDEVVEPAEINYVNGFDRRIAEARLQRFFQNVGRLARDYVAGVKVDGLVLALGGDMVSGNIHEELEATNEAGIIDTVLHWTERLAAGIEMLLPAFGHVYLPCVVGNHGRIRQDIRFKGKPRDSFDYLMYKMLERHFRGVKEVQFAISESSDARWTVYRTRMQMTHGDQFRGGTGISGLLAPLMLGDHRKRKREQATNTPYDILIMGHWHQLKDLDRVIVNGSLKGYDEYANQFNFDFELPRQAFWLTDPQHGKTLFAPVHVVGEDEPWRRQDSSAPSAEWMRAA